jgi:hypothetical protein
VEMKVDGLAASANLPGGIDIHCFAFEIKFRFAFLNFCFLLNRVLCLERGRKGQILRD